MEVLIAVVARVGEYLVEPARKQLRYLCCFNQIVEDLERQERRLESVQDLVQQDVERAKNNAEIIEKHLEDWISVVTNLLTEVHELEKKIQVNKTCLSGWCPSFGSRYWLGQKVAKKTRVMLQLIKDSGKFQRVSHPAPLPGMEFLAPRDFQFFQSSRSAFNQIIEALKNAQIKIVGLHGMGGTGKTTLATMVGKEVDKKMFDEVVMATVSQSPNIKKIQDELAESLSLKFRNEGQFGRAKELYLRFTASEKNILVILDDVWEAFDLQKEIGIPCGIDCKYCKVLLTTRFKQVCIDINCQQKVQLDVLNKEEGLSLLKKNADIGDDCLELNELAAQIAGECGGLPLALVAIGCALKGKGMHDWRLMYRKLEEAKLEDIPNVKVSGEKGIYNCFKISYDNLKGGKAKFCFLLCSLFPEDYKIPSEDLVKYMMGLDLYRSIEDARIELLSILDYLKDYSLFLDAGEGFVKMHDIVHDVALWIASKENDVLMSKNDMRLTEWSNNASWEPYTAVSFMDNRIQELPVGLVCSKLEILFFGW